MTIAVHISLPHLQDDISTNFNYNCFILLAAEFPLHHFIFIFDKPFSPWLITEKNITPVLSAPQIKNRLLQYYFYNFKIPRLLSKYNAACFFSAEVCSLRSTVSQYLIIHDLSFLKKKNLFSNTDTRYLRRYTGLFVKRSAGIVLMNSYLKTTLLKSYPAAADKITTLNIGIDKIFQPYEYQKADEIKKVLTDGKDYFLFFATPAAEENIMVMLKAFSIFKKWQKSNMQLVILFSTPGKENSIKGLSSYKYRADIKIFTADNRATTAGITASAYAGIHLPGIEIIETEGLCSMAAGVPVITTDNGFCKNMYSDTVLYSPAAEKELSEKMMLLYKDENTRNDLIAKGKLLAADHTWQNAARKLWQTIQPVTVS